MGIVNGGELYVFGRSKDMSKQVLSSYLRTLLILRHNDVGYRKMLMPAVSFKRHRFPPDVIRHAVWLNFRFALSLRDVEEMLAERGIGANYEAIRGRTEKIGKAFAHRLRSDRPAVGIWTKPKPESLVHLNQSSADNHPFPMA